MDKYIRNVVLAAIALLAAACAADGVTGARVKPGQGMLAVKLTDAPIPLDSLKEVNVFVVRIDARRAHTEREQVDDSLDVEHHVDEDQLDGQHFDSTAWVTIASPNRAFNLLNLQNGVAAFLGASPVDTGHFKGVRLVIDPARSSIVLKDGTVLTASSTPPVEFEERGKHALFVQLEDSLEVAERNTTTLTIDLKLNESLTLRGSSIRDGFIFRAVLDGRSHRDHD